MTPAPAIFLMGPTASGKTGAAVALAAALPVEIISVDSALVYFSKREVALGDEELRLATFAAADAAFGQRRKTLRQALADWAGSPAQAEEILIRAGISPQARGEELDVHQFVAIAKAK